MVLLSRYGKRFLLAVGMLSVADLFFWVWRVILTGTTRYSFIPWNLLLAWLSLLFAVLLVRNLNNNRWLSWPNMGLSLLWLAFLPNTWYLLTDFVHINPIGEISQLYDIVLICLLVIIGFLLGFASLFLVHRELLKRFSPIRSYWLIEAVILVASFSIYVGRDLRWNSWDVITNPGVIINVSDSIADPLGNPRVLNVTLLLFSLISLLYLAFWIFTFPAKPGRR
jgi:uncharacterized membrane protein